MVMDGQSQTIISPNSNCSFYVITNLLGPNLSKKKSLGTYALGVLSFPTAKVDCSPEVSM